MLPSRQNGAALLLVVWVVALLSLLAATALQITTASDHGAAAALERARMEAATDGATNLAILELIDQSSQSPLALGADVMREVGGYKVAVTVQDEAGKSDANRVSAYALKRLSQSYGLSERDAAAWSRLITTFRGDSDKPPDEVAKRTLNRTFRTVAEIGFATQGPVQVFNCLQQDLTVYTGLEIPDRRYMSADARRAFEPAADLSPQPPNSPVSVGSFAGRMLSINASLQEAKSSFVRHIVVRVTGDPNHPALVALWSTPMSSGTAQQDCRSKVSIP